VSLPVDYKKELQSFVKIIGHDLTAPIRHIKSFHRILMADFTLNDEQQELKGYVDDAIHRLESQLQGMLALSNFDTSEIKIIEVDIQQLLDDVIDSLHEKTGKSDITVSVTPNLTFSTDRGRLYLACFEIIGNALKFHREKSLSVVSVDAKIDDDCLLITITDNGIAIDSKYFEDIFQPFRCLNHQEKFKGTGMGLTLSRKALQRIAGKISVNSNAEQGCQFIISVPRNNK